MPSSILTYEEREQIEYEIVKQKYINGWKRVSTQDDLSEAYNTTYQIIYNQNDMGLGETQTWLNISDEAYKNNNINILDNIQWIFISKIPLAVEYDLSTINEDDQGIRKESTKERRVLYLIILSIIEHFPTKGKKLIKILSEINSYEAADLVLEAVEGSKHITNLPIGYTAAKKRRLGKRSKQNTQYTYEHAIRKNKHLLAKLLQTECNLGVSKSERISQILLYI